MGFEIINILKREKGITNAQLAQLSGITLSTIDKITSGINKNPKLDTLQAICAILGCTLNDFVSAPESAKKAPSISDEAIKVGTAYDAADSGTKTAVRKLLDVDTSKENDPIEAELASYRLQLEAEKEAKELLASRDTGGVSRPAKMA